MATKYRVDGGEDPTKLECNLLSLGGGVKVGDGGAKCTTEERYRMPLCKEVSSLGSCGF